MRLIDADQVIGDIKRNNDVEENEPTWRSKDVIQLLDNAHTPPNDPLTLEELREMNGEPVWNDATKNYMLVDASWWDGIGRAIDSKGKYRLLDDRYYRRKPEDGTT